MDRKIWRVLVVGAGSIGARHLRCFQATGRCAVGVCELRRDLLEEVSSALPVVGAYSTLEEALKHPWDAVLIATPAHTHIPVALRALGAGCHLLIEKPLSTSLEGVEQLRRGVESAGIVAAVSYNYRAHPGLRALKAAVDSGDYGKPLQVTVNTGQQFAKYRPAYPEIYFAERAQGGGAIQDAITHLWNLVEGLAGPVTRIAVDAGHQALAGVVVEDTVHAMARHGAVMASYSLNLYQHPNESSVMVVCEHGTLRFELHHARLRILTEADTPWREEAYPLEDRDAWYVSNANAFLDALEGKGPPLCTLDEGIQTLRVNLAALRSAETQRWVELGEIQGE